MGDREVDVEKALVEISDAENTENYDAINKRLIEKRLKWYEDDKGKIDLHGSDIRKAYTLLIIEYLGKVFGLDPKEAPVIFETEKKIVWRSFNWCPVLEACIRGHYDTREVCKKGWEQSVQVLIEKINPNLVFSRTYDKLRPHGEYCEESIELKE